MSGDKGISGLPVAATLDGTELVGIKQGANSRQTTTQDIADLASGGVSSVFTRTGAVVAAAGDYTDAQINNTSSVTGTHVKDALNTLKAASGVSSFKTRTGAVSPAPGDYDASQVTNDSSVSGASVADALDTLLAGGGGGGVSSFNSRTGAVVPAAGDYTDAQINNTSTVAGTHVSDALNTLAANSATPIDQVSLAVLGRTVDVTKIAPNGVTITDVIGAGGQTPSSLGYLTMAAYIAALPGEYRASVTSFSQANFTINDQTGYIALQTALNYIWDTWGGVGCVTWTGRLRINHRCIGNGIAIGVYGQIFAEREGGTILSCVDSTNTCLWSSSPTIDENDWMLYLFNYDNFGYAYSDRTTNGSYSGISAQVKYVVFEGPGDDLNLAPVHFISGLRTEASFGCHVERCTFSNGIYDGWVVTGASLWCHNIRNRYYGVHRDGFAMWECTAQSTTTFYSYGNYFGSVGRYCHCWIFWGAIAANSKCYQNIYEQASSSYYWENHPEFWVQGVKSTNVFLGVAGLEYTANYYEGSSGIGVNNVDVHLVDMGFAYIVNDPYLGAIYSSTSDNSQSRTNAMIAYDGVFISVSGVTKANPAVVTANAHGLSNGAKVRFFVANGGSNGMGQLLGPTFTVANATTNTFELSGIDSTSWGTFSGVNTKVTTGHRYSDITDTRNLRIAYRGNFPASGLSQSIFKGIGTATMFFNDVVAMDGTSRNIFEDVPVTLFTVPTQPAVNNEGHVSGNIDSVVATYRSAPLDIIFKNVSIDSKALLSYDNRTKNGQYMTVAGIATWAVATSYSKLLNTFRQPTMVVPTSGHWNGCAFQCVVSGTSHATTEPTWNTSDPSDMVITGITKANPAVVTAANHGFTNGESVVIAQVEGMTQVNNLMFTVAGATTNTFQLSGVDSSAYGTYTGQGTVYRVTPDNGVAWRYVLTGAYLSTENLRSERLEFGHRVYEDTAIPTTGFHFAGDIVRNRTASVTGDVTYWLCTVAGVPGTFANGPKLT